MDFTLSIPGGGHVQSSLQTRRQNSDMRHCQRTLLPDTDNTTLFLRLLRTSVFQMQKVLIKIQKYYYIINFRYLFIIDNDREKEDNDKKILIK